MTAPPDQHGYADPDEQKVAQAGERLEFAWHRSGLTLAAIGLAVVRQALPTAGSRAVVGPGLLAVGLFSMVAATIARHHLTSHGARVRVLTVAGVVTGALALLVSLAG
jgi:hypothetical protein